jgi:CBS domain-containing protein
MTKQNRLITDFYKLLVSDLMDKQVWDIPLIEEHDDIHHVLSILGGRNHIWVIKDKTTKILTGVITEHDVLSILAPKNLPSYALGMPDIRSLKHGTARTASDVMCRKIIDCKQMRMVVHRLRRLPVVDNQKIIGELTLHHLIRKYYAATQYHPLVNNDTEELDNTKEGD